MELLLTETQTTEKEVKSREERKQKCEFTYAKFVMTQRHERECFLVGLFQMNNPNQIEK